MTPEHQVRPEFRRHARLARLAELEQRAAAEHLSLPSYELQVQKHLEAVFEGAEVAVRMRPDALAGVLVSGVIRPGSQVGAGTLYRHRSDFEQAAFTAPPVHGYLARPDEIVVGYIPEYPIDTFGTVKVVLHVPRGRVYVTLGDQLWSMMVGAVPEPLDRPGPLCAPPTTDPLTWKICNPIPGLGADTYVGALVFGPLTLADIGRIELWPPAWQEPEEDPYIVSDELLEQLEAASVTFEVKGASVTVDA